MPSPWGAIVQNGNKLIAKETTAKETTAEWLIMTEKTMFH